MAQVGGRAGGSAPSVSGAAAGEEEEDDDDAAPWPYEDGGDGLRWAALIGTEKETGLQRAWSAEDAHVLRRKGHLKEQDALIEFIISLCTTHTTREAMAKLEGWVQEHRRDPRTGRLRRLVPCLGEFFTALPLSQALEEYDRFCGLSRRRYVLPNFAEVRHVLNMAQVRASAPGLRMITFDADGTLYEDGSHFEQDNAMIRKIIGLLQAGVHVGIVTAAGYPGEAHRFEARLQGLVSAFRRLPLPPDAAARFHVMGGECNYLLRLRGSGHRLEFVPPAEWQLPEMGAWTADKVGLLLDRAEAILRSSAAALGVPITVLRKERAVGALPAAPVIYETLEEMALSVQARTGDFRLPPRAWAAASCSAGPCPWPLSAA